MKIGSLFDPLQKNGLIQPIYRDRYTDFVNKYCEYVFSVNNQKGIGMGHGGTSWSCGSMLFCTT